MAPGPADLYRTVDALKANGVKLLDTIDTYYDLVDKRIPGHCENAKETVRWSRSDLPCNLSKHANYA